MLGFAGLIGARRTDVGLALFGSSQPTAVKSSLTARRADHVAQQALQIGIAYVTDDRETSASRCACPVSNMTLPTLSDYLTGWA